VSTVRSKGANRVSRIIIFLPKDLRLLFSRLTFSCHYAIVSLNAAFASFVTLQTSICRIFSSLATQPKQPIENDTAECTPGYLLPW